MVVLLDDILKRNLLKLRKSMHAAYQVRTVLLLLLFSH